MWTVKQSLYWQEVQTRNNTKKAQREAEGQTDRYCQTSRGNSWNTVPEGKDKLEDLEMGNKKSGR